MSPDRQPNAVRDVLGCAKAEALMLRNALTGGWARWGKTVQLASLTSSYSSLQGTDRYLGESVIQGPHEGVTFAGFLLTKRSQFHPASTRLSYPIEGRSTHEGKVAVSWSASLPGGINHAWRGFFWSEKTEKKGQPLTFWVLLLTGSILLVFFSSSPQRGSACALISGTRVW